MRRTALLTATALILGLSTASWADQWGNRSDRYGDRYSGDRVSVVAREIEDIAASIQKKYDRNNRRPDRDEARVSAALYDLRVEADRFQRQTVGYRNDSRYGGRGSQGLYKAFDRAADSLRYIAPRGYVDRGMDRIGSLLSNLEGSYGGNGRNGRGHYDDRDRRGDRGQYDRYDNRH